MMKYEFLAALEARLKGLPSEDVERFLSYYAEMIDDSVEDGMSEEEAVAQFGTPEAVATQILMDIPLPKVIKAKTERKGTMKTGTILLLVLGSPLWISLLAAAFSILVAIYAVIWSVVVTLWAVDLSLAVTAVGGVLMALPVSFWFTPAVGVFLLGGGLVCAGLALLLFVGCHKTTLGAWWLCKKILYLIKRCFVGGKEKS